MAKQKKRIVILGGGFGGVYTAIELEKHLRKHPELEIILINRENYFVFQPMLAEVVGGSVGILDTVSALRRLIPKTTLYIREIEEIDIKNSRIALAPQFSHRPTYVEFDELVIALGNVTDFKGMVGLHEHAIAFKNLADSITIRNRIIDAIEAASVEKDEKEKKSLMTFVVGGGGYSGTEIAAQVNDYVRKLIKQYPSLDQSDVKVTLIHSKERLMERELPKSLSLYAGKILQKRGVDIRFKTHLISASMQEAVLDTGERISSKTIISTVPSSPNPLITNLKLPQTKGKLESDITLNVKGQEAIWAIGDCALIPMHDSNKGFCPPTAQFAMRQGKTVALNIINKIKQKKLSAFKFSGLGSLGALGHHCAVAEIFGRFHFSGFIAWLMWRTIYWIKLPGFDRKLKTAFSWLLDAIIPPESVQLKIEPSQGISALHFEAGEYIFHEGDIGDYLYIITNGEVEVLKKKGNTHEQIATLKKGEYFGEMALVNQKMRSATVKCKTSVDVLALKKSDFGLLVSNFKDLKDQFISTSEKRASSHE